MARDSSPRATSGASPRPTRRPGCASASARRGASPRSDPRGGERVGKAWRVASICPAGERLVKYATVSHNGRHAGRGGLGAVLGSKLIKAVAVKPATKVPSHDPRAVLEAARDLRQRSFGP